MAHIDIKADKPGGTQESDNETERTESVTLDPPIQKGLTVMGLNIRSLVPKLEQVECLLNNEKNRNPEFDRELARKRYSKWPYTNTQL